MNRILRDIDERRKDVWAATERDLVRQKLEARIASTSTDLGVCPIVAHDADTASQAGEWAQREAEKRLNAVAADTPTVVSAPRPSQI